MKKNYFVAEKKNEPSAVFFGSEIMFAKGP